jgi:hypothetical protein
MNDDQRPADQTSLVLSDREKKVIRILREVKYGEIKVVVQDGIPVRMDEVRKSIKI